jgi:hypothetical protein
LRQNFAHLRTAADHSSFLIAFSWLLPAFEPHNAAREQQCDDQGKAGGGPGKVDLGIAPDAQTEYEPRSGDEDERSDCPQIWTMHIEDTGEIHLGSPDTLSLFQQTLIRTLVVQPTQYSGV